MHLKDHLRAIHCFIPIFMLLACSSSKGTELDSGIEDSGIEDSGIEESGIEDSGLKNNVPLDEFYDPSTIQTFELEIDETDLLAMNEALPERIYVPATFRWNDVEIENVGVRYKGNSSSNPFATHKRSFLIRFNEFVSGQRLLGLRRLAIDNGVQFGSLFSERLVTDILRDLGVTTMRNNYCRMFINGEYMGVYVNVERIDNSFLDHHFQSDEGPLFKCDEGGAGADMQYLGDDVSAYTTAFEEKNSEDDLLDAHLKELVEFIEGLNSTEPEQAVEFLNNNMEVDEFVPLLAVMLYAGAFDQLTGWSPHNYYLYKKPANNKWVYLAWDLDVGFSDNAFGQVPVLNGWNAAYPYPVAVRPLLKLFVENDELLKKYRQVARDVLFTYFDPALIIPKLQGLHDQIKADLADDPFPHVRATNPEDTDYQSIVDSMADFIVKRYDKALSELDNPQKTPPGEPVEESPSPGESSSDDPQDLHVTQSSIDHISLAWTDNATNEGGFVVQRCTGSGCTNFRNHIGLMQPNVEEAMDDAVMPGQTYQYRVYAIKPSPLGPESTGTSNVVEATAED